MRFDVYLITQLLLIIISCSFRLYNDYWYFRFDRNTEINFFNVGNGDSILTKLPFGSILLVDFGSDNNLPYYLGRILPFAKRNIDYVVLSHPHADHMKSMNQLLNEYIFDCFIYEDGYKEVNSIEKELRNKLHTVKHVSPVNEISLEEQCTGFSELGSVVPNVTNNHIRVTLFYYGDRFKVNDVTKNPNLRSVILRISTEKTNMFLLGDAEKPVQEFLYEDLKKEGSSSISNSFNIIKVPHQGSRDAINENLLRLLNPQIAIFSVGKNSYGHPHKESLEYYKNIKSSIFRTDTDGNIKIRIENDRIHVLSSP